MARMHGHNSSAQHCPQLLGRGHGNLKSIEHVVQFLQAFVKRALAPLLPSDKFTAAPLGAASPDGASSPLPFFTCQRR